LELQYRDDGASLASMKGIALRPDVELAPLSLEAAPRMLAWMQDAEVAGNIGLSREPSLEGTLAWLEKAQAAETVIAFAILLRGQHVGNVVFDQLERHLGLARLSVYLGEAEARGKGVGMAGMFLALGEWFAQPGWHKVWLTVHVENQAAIRTYERLGFQREGLLREAFLLGGRRVDMIYMGLLRSEFSDGQKS
jgi:RimJ/RimL family protein N-acetyltransferase